MSTPLEHAVVFIWTADAVTPREPITVTLTEAGRRVAASFAMPDVHGATMAPIAIAFLAALVGLFALADSRDGDRRAAVAGLRPGALLSARLGVLAAAALAATAISLAATAVVFDATRWPTYAAANILLALTYALIGALLAPIFGRVGKVFLAFLIPFLDIGIAQSPMLHPDPTTLSALLPGYGGSRVLLDGALSAGFDETRPSSSASPGCSPWWSLSRSPTGAPSPPPQPLRPVQSDRTVSRTHRGGGVRQLAEAVVPGGDGLRELLGVSLGSPRTDLARTRPPSVPRCHRAGRRRRRRPASRPDRSGG